MRACTTLQTLTYLLTVDITRPRR